jgi:hypothetical protein
MKEYLQKIKNNILNREYYEEVLTKPLSSSFRYYVKMSLWLTLIYTAFISIAFLPGFIDISRGLISDMVQSYPVDLKVHLRNGEASINLPEPLIIPLSANEKDIFKYAKKMGALENLMVIDTRSKFDLNEFGNYRSVFVLKKDSIAGLGSDGEVKVSSIKVSSTGVIISGLEIKDIGDKLQKAILVFAPFAVLVIYLLGVLYFIMTLGYLLVIALFTWLLFYTANRKVEFKQAFAVSLHACTFALVVNFFIFILYPSLSINFPFVVTFTLLIIYLNLIKKNKIAIIVPAVPKDVSVDTVINAEEKDRQIENESEEKTEK